MDERRSKLANQHTRDKAGMANHEIVSDRGGTAPSREIIEAVGRKLESRLTLADKEKTSSGVIRWQNRIQFVRLRLVEEGLLARDSGRGIWSLTDAGRARIKDLPEVLPSRR